MTAITRRSFLHQAFGDVMPVEEAVRRSYEYLKPFAAGAEA